MKVGIISDIHDNIENLRKTLNMLQETDVLICCGDLNSPFIVDELGKGYTKGNIHIVFGNNDGDLLLLNERAEGKIHKQPHQFELEGKRFVVMHEHHLVDALADSGHYDIVIFGHTHKAVVEHRNNTLVVNPGEAGHWLYGKATIGIIDTDKMDAEIISI